MRRPREQVKGGAPVSDHRPFTVALRQGEGESPTRHGIHGGGFIELGVC